MLGTQNSIFLNVFLFVLFSASLSLWAGHWPKWKIHCWISVFVYTVGIDINDFFWSCLPGSVTHVNECIDFCWNCIQNLYIVTQLECKAYLQRTRVIEEHTASLLTFLTCQCLIRSLFCLFVFGGEHGLLSYCQRKKIYLNLIKKIKIFKASLAWKLIPRVCEMWGITS